jgi:cation:H+ antiporter
MDAAMLFVADVAYREGPILENSNATVFGAGLGIILTCIYLWGLLEREDRSLGRLGWDSVAVVAVYLGGTTILYRLG